MSDQPAADSHDRSMTLRDVWTMAKFQAELGRGVVAAPWPRLNGEFLAGDWRAGSVYVLAGARHVGKTMAAQRITTTAAEYGHRVHVFSPAMEVAELTRRMVSTAAGVPISTFNDPRQELPPDVQQTVGDVLSRIGNRVSIADDHDLTIGRLRSAAQIEVRRRGCELIVIDHVHVIKADDGGLTDDEQLELVMSGLAEMAKHLEVPVIALARTEQDALGALERHGAVIMRLNAVAGEDQDNLVDVDILKNRFGPLGSVRMVADFGRQRFEEL